MISTYIYPSVDMNNQTIEGFFDGEYRINFIGSVEENPVELYVSQVAPGLAEQKA